MKLANIPGKKLFFPFFILLIAIPVQAAMRKQGDWYGYWGWNNATYSNSDIHFNGDDHDFTLHNVSAKDRQNDVNFYQIHHSYLNPMRLTIPQYNWRVGYFLRDNWSLSLGFDHMKYVMEQNQSVAASGYIDRAGFERRYQAGDREVLSNDFLTYEHTDGFNLISLETEGYLPLWNWQDRMDLALLAGFGGGVLYPKSNVKLLSGERNDEWHVAGYSTLVKIGLEATLWKDFFFRFMGKFGYADMNDVLTSNRGDKADQTFYYDEYIGVFGLRF
ncbi:hypothetical protein [Bacterioplanoides pacificum]|uniref:Outer membrane protein beta-barrel domain-containing protein n=1 Tax=Bacterioplanoides pacificum TaxID=1171596 RepID=A0ABV7VUI6_9GAMM